MPTRLGRLARGEALFSAGWNMVSVARGLSHPSNGDNPSSWGNRYTTCDRRASDGRISRMPRLASVSLRTGGFLTPSSSCRLRVEK
jgi:hypothetical protein